MDELPATARWEEKLEASVGRLAFEAGGDLTAANATDLHNLYVTLTPNPTLNPPLTSQR